MEKRAKGIGDARLLGQRHGERGGAARIVQRGAALRHLPRLRLAPGGARLGDVDFDRLDDVAGFAESGLQGVLTVAAGQVQQARTRREAREQHGGERGDVGRGIARDPHPGVPRRPRRPLADDEERRAGDSLARRRMSERDRLGAGRYDRVVRTWRRQGAGRADFRRRRERRQEAARLQKRRAALGFVARPHEGDLFRHGLAIVASLVGAAASRPSFHYALGRPAPSV